MVDCQPSPSKISNSCDKQPESVTAMCVTLVKVALVCYFYSSDLIITFQANTSPSTQISIITEFYFSDYLNYS